MALKREYILDNINLTHLDILNAFHINPATALFFDIETTGLSSKNSCLYMIGAVKWDNNANAFKLIQWFNEDGANAINILKNFFELSVNCQTLIHFNGDRFDIPYIKDCCNKYGIEFPLNILSSLDIYKLLKPFKNILKLNNMKQKTIEAFLGFLREDKMDGKELIRIYKNYLKSPDAISKELLFVHNADDLKGMLHIINALAYPLLFSAEGNIKEIETKEQNIIFHFTPYYPIPKRISIGKNGFYLNAFQKNITFTIPLYIGELKYFYPNYQDYYYLPYEDAAIHKIVASYVDAKHRNKAQASNCYTKKAGCFLPQPAPIINPSFKLNYTDSVNYFEATDENLKDNEKMLDYIKHLLSCLIA